MNTLAEAAIKLGENKAIMETYFAFNQKQQNWFFSPNPYLDGACRRPSSLDSWNTWRYRLSGKQRMTLAVLAGFKNDASDIILKDSHLQRLKNAYANKWKADTYSIFWDNAVGNQVWLCNVFVGDAIYLATQKSFTANNKHYFDPKQIYRGDSTLTKRQSYKDAKSGDIVVFNKNGVPTHVEIITTIHKHFFADTGFCSIGAGRGRSPYENGGDGTVKCDRWIFFSDSRELNNPNNTYYHL